MPLSGFTYAHCNKIIKDPSIVHFVFTWWYLGYHHPHCMVKGHQVHKLECVHFRIHLLHYSNYTHFAIYTAPSGNPNNVTVTELASDYVFLTWDPPSVHLHNGIIREYIVEVTTDEATAGIIHRTGTTSLLVSELHPDTTYYIRVAGHTVGVGPYSSPLSLHTLEDGMLYSCLLL